MVLVIFVVLLIAFVVLPFVGAAIGWVLWAFFIGLIIGAFGRLVVPGRQPIGCLGTVACGWIGSLGGGAIAGAIWGFKHNHHGFATILIEIGIAAVAVWLWSLVAMRYPPRTRRIEINHRIIDI
jgi:uncharacterized membrane protein YeaQ/YmgE (transglycosylase-associated protein family)